MDFQSLRRRYNIPDDTSATAMADALRVLERRLRPEYKIADHVSILEALKHLDEIHGFPRIAKWFTEALQTGATITKTLVSSSKSPIDTHRVTRSMSKAKDSPSSSTLRVDKGKGKVLTEEEIEAEFKPKSRAEHLRCTLSMMSKMPVAFSYKLCIVGDSGVGKTTFLSQHLGGVSRKLSANGIEFVYPIDFATNVGRICFNAFDSVRDAYLLNGDCAIIMFDVRSAYSRSRIRYWHWLIRQICGNIPIVVCANKIDTVSEQEAIRNLAFLQTKHVTHVLVSALTGFNFEETFLMLVNMLTDDDLLTDHDIDNVEIDRHSYTLSEPGTNGET